MFLGERWGSLDTLKQGWFWRPAWGSMVYGLVLNLAVDYIPIFRPSRGWFRVPTGPTVAMGMSLLQPGWPVVNQGHTRAFLVHKSGRSPRAVFSVLTLGGHLSSTELPPPAALPEMVLFSVSPSSVTHRRLVPREGEARREGHSLSITDSLTGGAQGLDIETALQAGPALGEALGVLVCFSKMNEPFSLIKNTDIC